MTDPVEAQAVPDLPVASQQQPMQELVTYLRAQATAIGSSFLCAKDAPHAIITALRAWADEVEAASLFTRPTPAAADLREALERVCSHKPRTPAQIDADWNFARAALAASPAAAAPAYKCMSVTEDGRSCRSWCGDARCDAAAGVPTGWKLVPIEPTTAMLKAGYEYTADMPDVWNAMLAASPVAPAGAPTVSDEQIKDLFRQTYNGHHFVRDPVPFARALLSAQGCELATDAITPRTQSAPPAPSESEVPPPRTDDSAPQEQWLDRYPMYCACRLCLAARSQLSA